MSPIIVPAPPGKAVGFDDRIPRRRAEPSSTNRFILGFFDRGTVGQFADVDGLRRLFGPRVNYSTASDAIAAMIAEGAGTITAARVVGPAATKATVTLDAKVRVTAKSAGAWANGASGGLKAEIAQPEAGKRRLIVSEGGIPVATSPIFDDAATLPVWSLDDPSVDVEIVAAGLPAVTAATDLAGGDDDRANVGSDDYTAALALLDPRYGPGELLAPGVTDPAVHVLLAQHGDATNRNVQADLPLTVTLAAAITHAQTIQADAPDVAWRVALWASWGWSNAIGGEPERLVPWSAVQSAIAARVERENGIGAAPFGRRRGVARTITRLAREWSTGHQPPGDTQTLYAAGVNVALDNGSTIAAEGYKSLSTVAILRDYHVAGTRMRLAWAIQQDIDTFGGENVDRDTLGSLHGRATTTCKRFVRDRAFDDDTDAGFLVVVDEVNDDASMARRELHVLVHFHPTGSADWVDARISSVARTETL